MDLVLRCSQFPKPGETVVALSFDEVPGGKGANQAVAAARAGASVAMLGRVGDDAFANRLIRGLSNYEIDCENILVTPDCESGLAMITVDQAGQNSIIAVEGANGRLSPEDVRKHRQVIESSQTVLLQLEIPTKTVLEVIQIARAANVRVILDPAPAPHRCPQKILQVDLICPNEHEAEELTGISLDSPEQILAAGQALYQQGARHVVITLGSRGSFLFDDQGGRLIPALVTDSVDTTAAGDAFAGALAVSWAEQGNLEQAVRFGNAAGAIAASKKGAQPSIGSRQGIECLLESIK
ncbi:Bifunctional ribokinase/ribose-5-phosphate isomerase A [Planctomycetes bacterium FF15]|uniref:Deoxyribokinase n=2 Tax=Bremerella alba TaxID=980252 RepID=A0A7V9A5U6_9BACT|nr:Bifunctional ribokinase/ribose-5-phosphate isomerase A [Bremerella alba]